MWIPVQLHLRSSLNVESIACSYGVCHVPVGIRGTQYYGRTHLHTVALHRRDVCRNHSSIYYFNASCTCVFSLTSLIVVASGSGAWAPLRVAIFFIFQRWGLRVWRKLKRLEVQKEKKKGNLTRPRLLPVSHGLWVFPHAITMIPFKWHVDWHGRSLAWRQ